MDKQSSIVAVVQYEKKYNEYAGITIRFGEFYKYNAADNWSFSHLAYCRYEADSLLSGLHLTCSMSTTQEDSYCWRIKLPEFELQYQYQNMPEYLDTHTKQIALIRKAVKKIEAHDSEFGSCATFGEFVQLVLKSLGVDYYVTSETVYSYGQSWEYFPYTPPIKDIRQDIDSLIKQQHELWSKANQSA